MSKEYKVNAAHGDCKAHKVQEGIPGPEDLPDPSDHEALLA